MKKATDIQSLVQLVQEISATNAPDINIFTDHLKTSAERKSFAGLIDPDAFFSLGQLLLQSGDTHQMQVFLDVFRYSDLLTRIYQDQRWADLILEMLQKSNYNFHALFTQRVAQHGEKVLFTVMNPADQTDYTWKEIGDLVRDYGKSLHALLGDNAAQTSVAFLCKNSLEMALCDLACLTYGIENIMIPANSVPLHIEYILNYTKPSMIIVSDQELLASILPIQSKLKFLQTIVLLENSGTQAENVLGLDEFLQKGNTLSDADLDKFGQAKKVVDRATIMFTSGTTGNPKGIMFSHQNIVFKRFARAMAIPEIGDEDIFLCYLPLYHTFGRWLELTGCIFWSARYVFMENPSAEAMLDNMKRMTPSVFISIPKKWYQLYERVQEDVNVFEDDDKKIRDSVKKLTGGNLKWGLSAAGHLDVEIFQFFQKYGVELMSGFGMTEATGGITMTPPSGYRPNSLGKALPGIELKFADDGELLIRGPYVMQGYINPEEAETEFIDGWLPTGDIMKVSPDGYIQIIDRKKEIYKNIKGETIAPQKIENYFLELEFIKRVFLVGDHQPFNTLLIYPNMDSKEVDIQRMSEVELRSYFSSVIVSVNQFLAPFERIVDFRLIERDFDPDKNELTPKGTFKRKNIEQNFAPVIEQMYRHEFSPVHIKNFEVQIPTWFIRECCVTQTEIQIANNKLQLKGYDQGLTIRVKKAGIQLGDFVYQPQRRKINLGDILQSPDLWLGNENLVKFTGKNIFSWSRSDERFENLMVIGVTSGATVTPLTDFENEDEIVRLHNSAIALFSQEQYAQKEAIEYLGAVSKSTQANLAFYAREILYRTIHISSQSLKEQTIPVMIDTLQKKDFQKLISELFEGKEIRLSRSLIESIAKQRIQDENLGVLFEGIRSYCVKSVKNCDNIFTLVSAYGANHPGQYKHIRQFLVNMQLNAVNQQIADFAGHAYDQLKIGFRSWLGTKQIVAVDIETGEEYTWDNVLTFEEGIDPKDQARLYKAITTSTIIREAIFLFSKGALVRLHDIPPGGVWVSLLGSDHGKSVYRVTVQTRYQGAFDLAINLNHRLSKKQVVDEIKWLVQTGSVAGDEQLVEEFGGYWPEFNLWTEEYIPGETAGKFLRRIERQTKQTLAERIQLLWPFFIWSATTGYVKFWMRSARAVEIKDPTPDNIIVPAHDYQTGTRIVSVSARRDHEDIYQLLRNIYDKCVTHTEREIPALKGIGKYKYILSGFIDAMGVEHGLRLLKECQALCKTNNPKNLLPGFLDELTAYIQNIEEYGYLPNKLYFAIKRYHRWLQINDDATTEARAETLSELYNTYQLHKLEIENPETRIRFFTATVFADSDPEFLIRMEKIIRGLRTGTITQANLSQYFSAIQSELQLSQDDLFFITRLTYPHLSPTDSADLITMEAGGVSDVDVVVRLQDYDGVEFRVRAPVNPKEITRLHQLFIKNNLMVAFTPEHRYLIAVNERGHLLGGLFYSITDEQSVHIEKVVVTNSYRKKGVSEGLINEFFKRMKSDHRAFVTTGFFRPEYFYRFGFTTERKYAGLVRKL